MSEVNRFKIEFQPEGAFHECVYAADFDRVTAERDALQALLTAADELNDVMAGLLRDASSWIKHNSFHGTDAIELWERIDAALKPAGGQLNQCDGCQAGIPVVNGAHRMGKPGAYPDTMSCTAKLYKP